MSADNSIKLYLICHNVVQIGYFFISTRVSEQYSLHSSEIRIIDPVNYINFLQ